MRGSGWTPAQGDHETLTVTTKLSKYTLFAAVFEGFVVTLMVLWSLADGDGGTRGPGLGTGVRLKPKASLLNQEKRGFIYGGW